MRKIYYELKYKEIPMHSRNALLNLKNRYISVLKKCNLLNTFGSLAFVGAITASLSFANMLMPKNAEAFTLPTGDYFFLEEEDQNKNYVNIFSFTEDGISTTYGLLYQNPVSLNTFSDINDLLKDIIPQNVEGRYIVGQGSAPAGSLDFDTVVNGVTTPYYVTPLQTPSEPRINNTLSADITSGAFYGQSSGGVGTSGGAILNESINGGYTITADFFKNTAQNHGGAFYNYANSGNANIGDITASFIANTATIGHGGAFYNYTNGTDSTAGIGDITASFIANISGDNGGAFYNKTDGDNSTASIGNINASFIANTATMGHGGAFTNFASGNNSTNSIGDITASFIANTADSLGGAFYNFANTTNAKASIGDINANFIANTAGTSGGAFYNFALGDNSTASIGNINASFIANNAGNNGGAFYSYAISDATASIGNINADFIDNIADTNKVNALLGLGGAIWINRSLNFLADSKMNIFSGNMDNTGYNAIYIEDSGHGVDLALNFNMQNVGSFMLNDSINTNVDGSYDLNITGQNVANNVFYLNNTAFGVKNLSLKNENLYMCSVMHDNTKYQGTIEAQTATFGTNSILTLDAQNYTTNAALQRNGGTGALTVEADAKLQIANATLGQTTLVTSGFDDTNSSIAQNAWTGNNILTSFSLYTANVLNANPSSYTVTFARKTAEQIMASFTGMQQATADYFVNFTPDYSDSLSAMSFFTTLLDNANGLGINNPTLVTITIESLLQAAAAGNTASNALHISNLSAETIQKYRTNLLNSQDNQAVYLDDVRKQNQGLSAGSETSAIRNGFAVWATPFFSNMHTSGFEMGSFKNGTDSNLGGLSIGADYTFNNTYRLGLAINGGGGSSESNGDFNNTTNDFDFFGVSLYGATYYNNITLSADIGYTQANNDIEIAMPTILGYSQAGADMDSNVFTLGAELSYLYKTQMFDIMPYLGLRYTNVSTSSYDVNVGASILVHTASDSQNIFSIPVGVILSKEFATANSWNITPSLDLGMICSFGDLEATSTSSIPTVIGNAKYKVENIDAFAFNGGIGLEVAKNNMSFALNYDLQASEHETSHGLQATFRYEF